MARKKRIFDIEMPEDAPAEAAPVPVPEPETFPAGKEDAPRRRRGPMATAIGEAADSGQARAQVEARIRAENDALAHEHVRLKRLGLVMELLPLEAIDTTKLARDRAKGIDYDLDGLKASITGLGLSNPIRVEATADGRYELVQGYRRLAAYKELLADTGDADRFATIPAAVHQPGDELETLYRRMVDENLVRKDISFAEMAQLALDYAADPATKESDPDKAVAELFQSAGYQKRSYIRSFIKLMARLGGDLRFAPDLPRALGLALVARMDEVEGLVPAIRAELVALDNPSVRDEQEVLRRHAGLSSDAPAPAPRAPKAKSEGKARTSFQFQRREGRARCTASNGKLELRLERDFSTIDRRKLEEAVRQMLDQLD